MIPTRTGGIRRETRGMRTHQRRAIAPPDTPAPPPLSPAALLVALVAIALSTGMLYLTVGVYGTSEGWYDTANYLSGALHVLKGHGYTIKTYDAALDTIRFQPITHYPPVTSLVYAFFLWLGVPLIAAPAWAALCCWPLFVGGIGVLTYRLSHSWWGAAAAVVIASLTNSFLQLYQLTLSEPVFLPLLVGVVVLLVGLPQRERLPPVQTGAAIVLLALLMMTRYAGVVFFGAAGLWWVWWRVRQGRARRLLWEVPLWSLATLPPAAWTVRNRLASEVVVGTHLDDSFNTFWEGVSGVLNQSIQLLFPALFPMSDTPILRTGGHFLWIPLAEAGVALLGQVLHLALQLAIVGIIVVLGRWLWKAHRASGYPLSLSPSPIGPMLAAFLFLYIVVQPFVSFKPMDFRDSTALLCLVQPLLVAVVVGVLRRRAGTVLAGYIAVNLLLIVVPVVLFGIPRVVSLVPPAVHDFPDITEANVYEERGIVHWLVVKPMRMSFMPRHRPEVVPFLAQVDTADKVIISNIGQMLFYYEGQEYGPAQIFRIKPGPSAFYTWLDEGVCTSRHNVMLLLMRRFANDRSFDSQMEQVEAKCPSLERVVLREDTVVYRLEQR